MSEKCSEAAEVKRLAQEEVDGSKAAKEAKRPKAEGLTQFAGRFRTSEIRMPQNENGGPETPRSESAVWSFSAPRACRSTYVYTHTYTCICVEAHI